MIRSFQRWGLVGMALAFYPFATHAANAYTTRLDREYKSYSEALARAAPPPPPPSAPARYTPPAYSSSSTASSYRPSSSGNSYGSSNSGSSAQDQQSIADSRKAWEDGAAARKKVSEQRALDDKAMWQRINDRAAADARERYRNESEFSPGAWEVLRTETAGKAPIRPPLRRTLESPAAEFIYYEGQTSVWGTRGPWEQMRVGQMCLLYQGPNANPSRAFGFFSKSNLEWPEVQLGLGLCYLRGYGVTPDAAKAREFLEKAAAYQKRTLLRTGFIGGGNIYQDIAYEACRELAVAYDLGRGFPPDATLAAQWYFRAQQRQLFTEDSDELKALTLDFRQRTAATTLLALEREYAAAKNLGPIAPGTSLLQKFTAARDAATLFALGEFADTKDTPAPSGRMGRLGSVYFFAAARLDHEPAARAFFSSSSRGGFDVDLGDKSDWPERAKFTRDKWGEWEKKWQDAAAAGDASANIPLAFYYSGARGNRTDQAQAQRHAAKLPATIPAAQRDAIGHANWWAQMIAHDEWAKTIWAKFGTTSDKIDLTRLATPPDAARGETLRESGNALAAIDLTQARDLWRDAAVLGDLPAQVQLYNYAGRHKIYLGEFGRSLYARLETAAQAGDRGAVVARVASLGGNNENSRRAEWVTALQTLFPESNRFRDVAKNPASSDADYAAARAAALLETEGWKPEAQKWGFAESLLYTLSPQELSAMDAQRAKFLALAALATRLEAQLALWEKTVEYREFDPESDARYLQGHQAMWDIPVTDRDPVLALDYFSQSAGLGHPLAPLVIGFYFGSGYGGLPKNAAISQRFRALADARLTVMAEAGDSWAQIFLGDLLTDDCERENNAENPGVYAWLPLEKARGLKWLQLAALNGEVLPHNFGDSTGRPVAGYVSSRYQNWGEDAPGAKWAQVNELFIQMGFKGPPTAAQWATLTAEARAVVAMTPEMGLMLAALDKAIEEAEGESKMLALRARARGLVANHFPFTALNESEKATWTARASATAWGTLGEIQQHCGYPAEAVVSTSLARALAGEAAAPVAFETALAALAKIDPDRPEDFRSSIVGALEDQPDSSLLKDLMARAAKLVPAEKKK